MFLILSATNVSQFAQPKKHHGQQCVRDNVSSFTRDLRHVHSNSCLNISLLGNFFPLKNEEIIQ